MDSGGELSPSYTNSIPGPVTKKGGLGGPGNKTSHLPVAVFGVADLSFDDEFFFNIAGGDTQFGCEFLYFRPELFFKEVETFIGHSVRQ